MDNPRIKEVERNGRLKLKEILHIHVEKTASLDFMDLPVSSFLPEEHF